jgi:alkylation response protein AidB-like acyl-CoA dehydrogenase
MVTTTNAERSENARLIKDSASFVASPDRLRKVRALRYQLPGFDPEEWKGFADLGWFALRLPEERGGTGFGVLELCALAEQLGTGLVAAPVLPAISIASLAPDDWSERIVAGEAIVLPAWQEGRGILLQDVTTRIIDGRLFGLKRYVLMAASADAYLVTTASGLALVQRDAAGVSLTTDLLQDGGHYGTLSFDGADAIEIAGDYSQVREEITLATAAYLLGAMRSAFAITSEYLGTRKQFDKPIGSFQSLQHRMVDLYIQIELTRASVWKAALILDEATTTWAQREVAVSRAKARASEAAMLVTRQAVQLHGGIGYTDECDVGLYLRKAMVLANFHGSAAQHRARFSRTISQSNLQ